MAGIAGVGIDFPVVVEGAAGEVDGHDYEDEGDDDSDHGDDDAFAVFGEAGLVGVGC